jgi:hypothetical protein
MLDENVKSAASSSVTITVAVSISEQANCEQTQKSAVSACRGAFASVRGA